MGLRPAFPDPAVRGIHPTIFMPTIAANAWRKPKSFYWIQVVVRSGTERGRVRQNMIEFRAFWRRNVDGISSTKWYYCREGKGLIISLTVSRSQKGSGMHASQAAFALGHPQKLQSRTRSSQTEKLPHLTHYQAGAGNEECGRENLIE